MMKDDGSSNLPESGFVDAQGLRIYFQRFGIGHPIVLAHGWGSDSKHNWIDCGWVEHLKRYRTVVAIDIRGHGRSDKPHSPAPYSYAAMSQDILAVMDALSIAQADFMGYSMGSFIGAHLLGYHAPRFTSMIFGGFGNETKSSAARGQTIAQALRAANAADIQTKTGRLTRRFAEANPNNDLEALACSAETMWPQGYPLEIAGPEAGQIQLPVLIVNGEHDHPYVDSADEIAATFANATHQRIAGTDHLTTVTADQFKQAVLQFLLKQQAPA